MMAENDQGRREFGWVLVELMGHRQRIGRAREEEVAGGMMLRIDIPTAGEDYVTEYYGASAIYALRPVSEAVARDHFAARDPRPARPADYRPALDHRDDDEAEDEDA
jgi:hypothetical protein